jgi:hypothetical protein
MAAQALHKLERMRQLDAQVAAALAAQEQGQGASAAAASSGAAAGAGAASGAEPRFNDDEDYLMDTGAKRKQFEDELAKRHWGPEPEARPQELARQLIKHHTGEGWAGLGRACAGEHAEACQLPPPCAVLPVVAWLEW